MNAPHFLDGLAPPGALQLRQPADAAAHRRSTPEAQVLLLGQGHKNVVEGGNERLVGGDDVLARLHGGLYKLESRVQSPHGLHHRIDGRILQHILKIPGYLGIGQSNVLQTYHLCHLHILAHSSQLINALAYNAKTKQSDFHNF